MTIRPGSVAGRAVAFLRDHGRTAGAPLAEACDCDEVDLRMAMTGLVQLGTIRMERDNGLRYWELVASPAVAKPRLRRVAGWWHCVVGGATQCKGKTPLSAYERWQRNAA